MLACWLLFMNEGWAIKTHQTLNEVRDNAIHVSAAAVQESNYGKLIHASHRFSVNSPLVDHMFGVQSDCAVSLQRHVEMYQWIEHARKHERKLSNGEIETTTTYTYSKDWKSSVENSANFRKPHGHENPGSFPYEAVTFSAEAVQFGGFSLSPSLVSQISGSSKIHVSDSMLPDDMKNIAQASGQFVTISGGFELDSGSSAGGPIRHIETIDGEDQIVYEVPSTGERFTSKAKAEAAMARSRESRRAHANAAAKIGDVRVSFEQVPCKTVSVLAKQQDGTLVEWESSIPGYSYAVLHDGVKSVDSMIDSEQSTNTVWMWVKRIGGFILNYVGFSMMTGLLYTVIDWLPIVRNLVSLGLFLMNGTLATSLSFIVISIGWIFYRPLVGCTLLAIGVGSLFVANSAGAKNQPCQTETVKSKHSD
jgi:hypothetical protein